MLGLGLPALAAWQALKGWSPTTLFAAGEAGGVWDFTTLANLYQDSAGTTPCTAVGQPIGKVLDTSGRGNHLTQSTSTKRPVLGRMPAGGVRNLLTYTEQITTLPWVYYNSGNGAALSPIVAPDGTTTAIGLDDTSGDGYYGVTTNAPITAEVSSTFSCYVKQGTNTTGLSVWLIGAGSNTYFQGTLNWVGGVPTASGWVAESVGSGWYRVSFDFLAAASTSIAIYLLPCPTVTTETGSTYFWGVQLEIGSTATAYQKVGAAYDVTESGVASVYTAYFDGVDDCLVSPSIDFSGTDKMSVFAGFRKTSDAARGMVAELSATTASNNGSFALTAPNAASATIVYESKGTALTDTSATIAAPADSVIAAVSDISADSNVLRRNGAEAESDTGDQGTGNFGNYPIYVGQRGAASLPYKGFLSALCTRGAATDAALVTSMEKWMAARTPGVTLP